MRNKTILTISTLAALLTSCGSEQDLRGEFENQEEIVQDFTSENEVNQTEDEGQLSQTQTDALTVITDTETETETEQEAPEGSGEDTVEAVIDQNVTLVASKSYDPSTWFNAEKNYEYEVSFLIPESIAVTAGNAGNHWTDLKVMHGETEMTCRYKGGADISKPIAAANASQIEKGLFYHLDSCEDGSIAGDLITVTDIFLTVANGDKTETTEVTLYLDFVE